MKSQQQNSAMYDSQPEGYGLRAGWLLYTTYTKPWTNLLQLECEVAAEQATPPRYFEVLDTTSCGQ
jgi:hypothetical protein